LGFRKISLQEQLVTSIEKVMEKTGTYRSIAEFVSEAVRLRIEDIEKQERARKTPKKQQKAEERTRRQEGRLPRKGDSTS